MKLFVTGGAGFIGSHIVRAALARGLNVLNYDALTYAANPLTLADIQNSSAHRFVHADINDGKKLHAALRDFRPGAIIHCAAETHVDRSIDSAIPFVQSNVMGTLSLLEAAMTYWQSGEAPQNFRVISVSTDEVYGSIPMDAAPVQESAPYNPSSPYAASKASADHLARAYYRTHGLPVMIGNCCNNYGAFQFPEKLIPHMILRALAGRPLPVYGNGLQVRDWIHVDDHVEALFCMLEHGTAGESYVIGAQNGVRNIDMVHMICDILDASQPPAGMSSYRDLISFVTDRPGHDTRYAVNPEKLQKLGWAPRHDMKQGLQKTVSWYLQNDAWTRAAFNHGYELNRIGRREATA